MKNNADLSIRCAPAPEDAFSVLQIRIDFALHAYISQEHQQELLDVIDRIVRADYNQPVNGVFWPAGIGSMPHFSQADSAFLGRPPEPNAPATGEPTFDDSIFHIDCAARPFVTDAEREKYAKRREVSR